MVIIQKFEPVTLIGGAEAPAALLQRAVALGPTVVAADSGAAAALAHDLMLEAVIGDLDSIPEDMRTSLPAALLHRISEQDSTDFEKCLTRIDAPVILGVGFSAGRVDHQLAVCNALVRWPARRCVLIGAEDVMFLAPPSMTLDLPKGCRVSLFPMGAVDGRSEGLKWPIDGLVLTPDGQIATSNVALGAIQLRVTAPKLLTILPLEHLEHVVEMLLRNPSRWG